MPENEGDTGWGRWRRCPTCKRRVWLTKRGKLCKHIDDGHEGADPFAVLSSGIPQSVPRCDG